MADISQELSQIKNSVYGKNMRTAIHDAIKKVNEDGGGGGSGGATIDTLWSDSSGATVGTEYTMNGAINDYDVIYLNTSTRKDLADINQYDQFSVLTSMIGSSTIGINSYFKRYMQIAFNGTSFTVLRASCSDEMASDYTPILYKIVGIKF